MGAGPFNDLFKHAQIMGLMIISFASAGGLCPTEEGRITKSTKSIHEPTITAA
jgi:hypothetical protein